MIRGTTKLLFCVHLMQKPHELAKYLTERKLFWTKDVNKNETHILYPIHVMVFMIMKQNKYYAVHRKVNASELICYANSSKVAWNGYVDMKIVNNNCTFLISLELSEPRSWFSHLSIQTFSFETLECRLLCPKYGKGAGYGSMAPSWTATCTTACRTNLLLQLCKINATG